MPNRFQNKEYDRIWKLIAARDGEHCLVGRIRHEKCDGPLQIDHADRNPKNSNLDNLHLVCRKHNLELRKLSAMQHESKMAIYSAKNVCV